MKFPLPHKWLSHPKIKLLRVPRQCTELPESQALWNCFKNVLHRWWQSQGSENMFNNLFTGLFVVTCHFLSQDMIYAKHCQICLATCPVSREIYYTVFKAVNAKTCIFFFRWRNWGTEWVRKVRELVSSGIENQCGDATWSKSWTLLPFYLKHTHTFCTLKHPLSYYILKSHTLGERKGGDKEDGRRESLSSPP